MVLEVLDLISYGFYKFFIFAFILFAIGPFVIVIILELLKKIEDYFEW